MLVSRVGARFDICIMRYDEKWTKIDGTLTTKSKKILVAVFLRKCYFWTDLTWPVLKIIDRHIIDMELSLSNLIEKKSYSKMKYCWFIGPNLEAKHDLIGNCVYALRPPDRKKRRDCTPTHDAYKVHKQVYVSLTNPISLAAFFQYDDLHRILSVTSKFSSYQAYRIDNLKI